MNILFLSDLHVDACPAALPPPAADVVVLGGGIGVGSAGLAWLNGQGLSVPVVYVPGVLELSAGIRALDGLAEAVGPNVHLLYEDAVVIQGVRFVGSLLWTAVSELDPPECCFTPEPSECGLLHADPLRESLQIHTPADARRLHRESRAQLWRLLVRGSALRQAQGERLVVVTVHGLASAEKRPRFAKRLFTQNMLDSVRLPTGIRPPDLWLHGQMVGSVTGVIEI
ncbi:MAG: hypothetical protein OEY07_16190 [Gammaproteobacteria bacterium]|nr:hypothetical protein [Gammaproteobacteria bacterium]